MSRAVLSTLFFLFSTAEAACNEEEKNSIISQLEKNEHKTAMDDLAAAYQDTVAKGQIELLVRICRINPSMFKALTVRAVRFNKISKSLQRMRDQLVVSLNEIDAEIQEKSGELVESFGAKANRIDSMLEKNINQWRKDLKRKFGKNDLYKDLDIDYINQIGTKEKTILEQTSYN